MGVRTKGFRGQRRDVQRSNVLKLQNLSVRAARLAQPRRRRAGECGSGRRECTKGEQDFRELGTGAAHTTRRAR